MMKIGDILCTQNGKFKLTSLIDSGVIDSEGSGGTIYRGKDEDGKMKAIKTIRSDVDEEVELRFLREIQIMKSLMNPGHLGIPKIYGEGITQDGEWFYVCDYFRGQNLYDHIVEDGDDSLEESVLACMVKVLDVLQYIHEGGIIHRDVKPDNIMLSKGGILLDFGVARRVADLHYVTEGWVGTLGYMAPEEIRSHVTIDHRADIYGVGATLYFILTSSNPFCNIVDDIGFDGLEDMLKKKDILPTPILDLNPFALGNVAEAAMKALSPNPNDRYSSAKEFAYDLIES